MVHQVLDVLLSDSVFWLLDQDFLDEVLGYFWYSGWDFDFALLDDFESLVLALTFEWDSSDEKLEEYNSKGPDVAGVGVGSVGEHFR